MADRVVIRALDELQPGDCIQHRVADGVLVTRDWVAAHNRELRAEVADRVRELSRQGYSAQEAANKIERDA